MWKHLVHEWQENQSNAHDSSTLKQKLRIIDITLVHLSFFFFFNLPCPSVFNVFFSFFSPDTYQLGKKENLIATFLYNCWVMNAWGIFTLQTHNKKSYHNQHFWGKWEILSHILWVSILDLIASLLHLSFSHRPPKKFSSNSMLLCSGVQSAWVKGRKSVSNPACVSWSQGACIWGLRRRMPLKNCGTVKRFERVECLLMRQWLQVLIDS